MQKLIPQYFTNHFETRWDFQRLPPSHGSDPAASNLQDPEALMAKVERGQIFHHLMTMKGWAK